MPIDNLDSNGFSFLAQKIRECLADLHDDVAAVSIVFLDAPETRRTTTEWAADIQGVLTSLWQTVKNPMESEHIYENLRWYAKPLLLIGLGVLETNTSHSIGKELKKILDWPGSAYLPYGFTRDELIETTLRILQGAKTPLPFALQPKVGDVLRLTSEIRHWLENRRRNTLNTANNFERAARGEIRLHEYNLMPIVAVSDEHRDMLERLWALAVPAAHLAPKVGGLKDFRQKMVVFEQRWQVLETARAAVITTAAQYSKVLLADVTQAHQRVIDALSAAIDATQMLEHELTTESRH